MLWWSTDSGCGWASTSFEFSVKTRNLLIVPVDCQLTRWQGDTQSLTSASGPNESVPFDRPFLGPSASLATAARLKDGQYISYMDDRGA